MTARYFSDSLLAHERQRLGTELVDVRKDCRQLSDGHAEPGGERPAVLIRGGGRNQRATRPGVVRSAEGMLGKAPYILPPCTAPPTIR
jgi:hypothetical protein